DLERQVGVRQAAPGFEGVGRHLRQGLGDGQPAIGRQAFEEDVAERLRRHAAAGRYVFHRVSTRRRVTLERTNGNCSMLRMAWSTLPSTAWWVRKMISAPPMCDGCWIIEPIEMQRSASTRAMSASTPGWSSTRRRK